MGGVERGPCALLYFDHWGAVSGQVADLLCLDQSRRSDCRFGSKPAAETWRYHSNIYGGDDFWNYGLSQVEACTFICF